MLQDFCVHGEYKHIKSDPTNTVHGTSDNMNIKTKLNLLHLLGQKELFENTVSPVCDLIFNISCWVIKQGFD